ncbi:hypothetical protein H7849_05660 [Alloacidobacterium dinghuense]|uniref:Uncharacterized protein n=1 Tax=Alloacidobacterium dinghuense TaxID=2763107 RepID=A0A7G8BLL4_9BACT|nr:hypothetical protein [Alloacidobacterium dinghuense]QNI33434.1 hypothetical protein H7849_05660 [Alloacidobacterium dinghuense]
MIAQQVAIDHPDLVERLILLGTGPRGGEGMTFTELSAEEQADPVAFLWEHSFLLRRRTINAIAPAELGAKLVT